MNIQDFTTDQLRAELKERGYYVDNLWQEDDIDTLVENYNAENGTTLELTKEHKQEILNGVLAGDGCMQNTNDELGYFFEEYIEENSLLESDIAEDLHDARNYKKDTK